MKTKLLLVLLNSTQGSEHEKQIVSAAKNNGHEIMIANSESSYIFIPDIDLSNTNKSSLRGQLVEVNNKAAQQARSQGNTRIANVLSDVNNVIKFIENNITSIVSKHKTTDVKQPIVNKSADGVNWEVLNNLQHMKEASNI